MSTSRSRKKEKAKAKAKAKKPSDEPSDRIVDLSPTLLEDSFEDKKFFGFDIEFLEKTIEENDLGYMRFNIVNPPAGTYWGKFNNRTIDRKWVDDLCESFMKGIKCCNYNNVMDIALDPKWITTPKASMASTIKGVNLMDVPLIAFTPEGAQAIRNNNLWVLSGNHRRLAMLKYMKHLNEMLRIAKRNLKDLEEKMDGDEVYKTGEEGKKDLENTWNRVKLIEAKIERSFYWTVRVYDRGKIEAQHPDAAKAIFRLISRNTTLDTHRATDEEQLQEIVDELKDALEEDLLNIKDVTQVENFEFKYPRFKNKVDEKAEQFKNTKYNYRRICSVPSFALGLVMASRVQTHFTHSSWFKLSVLSGMLDVYGTFISEFIVVSVEYLERIANPEGPPLNFATIEEKRSSFYEDGDSNDLRNSLAEMETAFKKPGDLSLWSPELLDDIDAAFVKNYLDEDGESATLFFPHDIDNFNRFKLYCAGVDEALRKHAKSAPPHAREYFAFYSIWQMREWKFPMPLGTASVVTVLNNMLNKMKNGFAEVISWIATAISWTPLLNQKLHLSYDQFDTMIATASQDPLLLRNPAGLRRQMFTMFLNHLTTFIAEIEIYISTSTRIRNSIPKQIAKFKALHEEVKEWKSPTSFVPSKELANLHNFITSLNLPPRRFFMEWNRNFKTLETTRFVRSQRIAEARGERLLVMSGLTWNTSSKSRERDWAPTVAAITLETAVVEFYREEMLKRCSGACKLRDEIRNYFLSVAILHHEYKPGTREPVAIKLWDFPDGYLCNPEVSSTSDAADTGSDGLDPTDAADAGPGDLGPADATDAGPGDSGRKINADARVARKTYVYDAAAIKKNLNQANVANTSTLKSKGKQKNVLAGVESLTKYKLLWSSEPNVSNGTLETLAYHFISGLTRIVYFNAARIAHEKSNEGKDGQPFDAESVKIPMFEPTSHVNTEEYAGFLGYDNFIFKLEKEKDDVPTPASSQPTESTTRMAMRSSGQGSGDKGKARATIIESRSPSPLPRRDPLQQPAPSDSGDDAEGKEGDGIDAVESTSESGNVSSPVSKAVSGAASGAVSEQEDTGTQRSLPATQGTEVTWPPPQPAQPTQPIRTSPAADAEETQSDYDNHSTPIYPTVIRQFDDETERRNAAATIKAQQGEGRGSVTSKRPPPTSPPDNRRPTKRVATSALYRGPPATASNVATTTTATTTAEAAAVSSSQTRSQKATATRPKRGAPSSEKLTTLSASKAKKVA